MADITLVDEEVYTALHSLDPTKSAGCDGLHPKLLKEAVVYLFRPLIRLYNYSLKEGMFPQCLNATVCKPLRRKSDSRDSKDDRPIYIVSAFLKVFEKCVDEELRGYVEIMELWNAYQSAFMKGRSWDTAVLKVTEDSRSELDAGNVVAALAVDLQKAFSSLEHCFLVNVLRDALRIGVSILRWYTTYLTKKTKKVLWNDAASEPVETLCGVPQGTVLGPILFYYVC